MKAGSSSLNPYAASYVPLFKRGVANVNRDLSQGQEQNSNQLDNSLPRQNVSQSYGHGAVIQTGEVSKRKDGQFLASTSKYPNAMQLSFDEEFDMDLAYLQMTFPGISEESLYDVYLANRCDLDAAVDMLNQLEIYPDDSSDKLPDTLDIGDVPESHKIKNPTTKTGSSTSGSLNIS